MVAALHILCAIEMNTCGYYEYHFTVWVNKGVDQ